MFGLDNRDQGVYDTGNSDVIMVMNINNDTKEVSLVSVYRDTYLNIAGEGEEENSVKPMRHIQQVVRSRQLLC